MRAILLAIAGLGSVCVTEAPAQTVHAVLIGDTTDATIGVGITENLRKMRNFLRQAEVEGELTVSVKEVRDGDFNCRSIQNAVKALPVQSNDAVVFYYAGHGFRRNSTQTQFPEFDCRRTADPERAELAGISNQFLTPAPPASAPRFLLSVADTCNREAEVPTPQAAGPRIAAVPDRKAGFRRLFLQYSGTMMMSGSVPGEFSWYMNGGPQIGGFFTNQLLRAVNAKLISQADHVRWEDIATDATKRIFIPSGSETSQTPQYATLNLSAQ